MKETKDKLKPVRELVQKFINMEKLLCSLMLVIMVVITFTQVIMRFIFNAPFSWSEEITLILLVWFGYLCMPIDIFSDSHAALYFLYNKLPSAVKKAADLIRHGLLIWLFVEMMIYGMTITKLNLPKLQPATRISQGWLFAPLVVGGGLMLIYSILNLISTILKPLSEYKKEAETEKDIAQLNRERGGTE